MGTFIKNKHSDKVKEIFSKTTANTQYPFPRPVQGNTVDFAITYRGAHLLDGKCKSADNEGHKVLIFYLTQQLVWKYLTVLTVLEKNFPGFTIGTDPKEDRQVLHSKPRYLTYMTLPPYLMFQMDQHFFKSGTCYMKSKRPTSIQCLL